MPGDFPGIPMLANGGLFGPRESNEAALAWARTQVAALKATDDPKLLDRIKGFAARGLAAVLDDLPGIPTGVPQEARQMMGGVKDAVVTAIRHMFDRVKEWNPDKIMDAFKWAMAQMGKPYVWGGGHGPWNYNLPGYDCSGFASHAAKKAGAHLSSPGTTMSLFPMTRNPGSNTRLETGFGFRGMSSSDPRRQHMGMKILGSWFQFGNPGRRGGSDAQWDHLRAVPGLPGYATGTSYVPETGPAILHRGEAVIPARQAEAMRQGGSASPAINIETMIVQDANDVEILASRLGRQLAMRVPA